MNSPSLRHRKRQLVQAEITETALRLFRERGYAETTIDDLAAASGMSRRTFFRYFPSKDDVVAGKWTAMGEGIVAALGQRPADEDPWTSLRESMAGIIEHYADATRRTDSYALDEVVDATPSLRAAFVAKVDAIAEAAAAVLVERGVGELRAHVFAKSAAAALISAIRQARLRGAQGIGGDFDEAMATLIPR